MRAMDYGQFSAAVRDIARRFAEASSEEERETLRRERAEAGEAYREWHLQRYGWAYGSY